MWCTNIWKTHINSSTWSALTPQSRSSWSTLRKISRVLAVYVILSRVFTELVRWCSWLSTYELKHARMKTMRFHCDVLSYPVFSDPLVSSDEHQWCFDYSSSASPPLVSLFSLYNLTHAYIDTATVVTVPGSHTRTNTWTVCVLTQQFLRRSSYHTSLVLRLLCRRWRIDKFDTCSELYALLSCASEKLPQAGTCEVTVATQYSRVTTSSMTL